MATTKIKIVSSPIKQPKDFLSSEKTQEFILNLKPYSHLATNDSITIKMRVVAHDYQYKDDLDWYIDEVYPPLTLRTS